MRRLFDRPQTRGNGSSLRSRCWKEASQRAGDRSLPGNKRSEETEQASPRGEGFLSKKLPARFTFQRHRHSPAKEASKLWS